MIFDEFQQIRTSRLILRKLRREDAADFFQFAGSDAVTEYMLWKPHQDEQESLASIEKTLRRYEAGKCYRWGIALNETDTLIGIIDLLSIDEDRNTCTFAYMLSDVHWGKGYGTEALTAILDFAFCEMGVDSVEADHFAENTASGAVMRKVGMTYLRTQPQKYEKNGLLYDAPRYRIDRQTWLRKK